MDTSETYIKMRIKAIPDLGMGDESFALKSPYFVTDNVWIVPNGNFYCRHNLGKEDVIIGCQLERQDQLQEMVGKYGHFKPFTNALIDFAEWYRIERTIYCERNSYEQMETRYSSMEQLWLAFMMKEKHGKVWNGEDWIPAKAEVKV